jgi:hypothetical protein
MGSRALGAALLLLMASTAFARPLSGIQPPGHSLRRLAAAQGRDSPQSKTASTAAATAKGKAAAKGKVRGYTAEYGLGQELEEPAAAVAALRRRRRRSGAAAGPHQLRNPLAAPA